jgi:hypothetical protein
MPPQPEDPPIIVSGGSVTIRIPVGIFPGLLPGGDFTNPLKEITRVVITGSGIPNYDESAKSSDITITIEYADPKP